MGTPEDVAAERYFTPKKRMCFKCYREATLYQPPELGLKPLCMFPEQLTEKAEECEVHGWHGSEIWQELLGWMDALTIHNPNNIEEE